MKSDHKPPKTLPRPVADALPQIGAAIRTARIRRRKTASDLAQRLNVSLPTFVTALWLLDLLQDFCAALDPANDRLGITLDLARISKRVRRTKDLDLGEL
jgi:hypothetical protein